MTRPFILLTVVGALLCSLSAWGDEGSAPAPLRDDDVIIEFRAYRGDSGCGPYGHWDTLVNECIVYEKSLIPRLEYSPQVSRYLLRPPEGVIVLYPDGSRAEAAVCPPEFDEETRANNWRFCRDPEHFTRIPHMWNPPVNGIPFEEAEAIYEDHQDALMALDGVTSVALRLHYIVVNTDRPELVPEEIDGVPIRTAPPIFAEPLSLTMVSPLRPSP